MTAMIIKEKKSIYLNSTTLYMFVKNFYQPLISKLVICPTIFTEANDSIMNRNGSQSYIT